MFFFNRMQISFNSEKYYSKVVLATSNQKKKKNTHLKVSIKMVRGNMGVGLSQIHWKNEC